MYDPIKIGSIDGTDIEPHDKGIERAIYAEYRPNRHTKGRPQCTIFVSRLSLKTTKDSFKEFFSRFGKINRFRVVRDIVTGYPKGYAFIEYADESGAEEAYRKAYKMVLDGNELFIDFECERLLKGWKPRRVGGGFGGKKESGQLRFGGRDRPFKKPIVMERMAERLERNGRNRSRSRSRSRSRDRYRRRHDRR